MWAILRDNIVLEITNTDPYGRFHTSFTFISCDKNTKVGMTYEDGKYSFPSHGVEEQIIQERAWRNAELFRADLELNKVQDSDPKAKGSVADWRNYRKALRALPEHPDFPNKTARPTPPDSV